MTTSPKNLNADPNVWGPPLWDLLFTFAYKLPSDPKKRIFRNLARQLEFVLPCQHCRRSYIMYRKQVPENLENPAEWLWTIHDMVNQNLGKICITYSKLQDRHGVFTCMTNPLIVLDIFCIMTAVIKHNYVRQFISTILEGCKVCPGMCDLLDAFVVDTEDEGLEVLLWKAHNFLRARYKIPVENSFSAFWSIYKV